MLPGLVCLLVIAPAPALGQTITAQWDLNPSSDQVTGYQVCLGTTALSCNVQLVSVGASQSSYTFSPAGGVLYRVAVRAVSASGVSSYSSEVAFSIPGLPDPGSLFSTIGVAISPFDLSATDPDGDPLSYSHTGLPVGLVMDQTGRISGTPGAVGTHDVTVFVSDSTTTVSRSFTWTITTTPSADTMAPALSVTSHVPGQVVRSSSVTISGAASDSARGGTGISNVTVNGQSASGGTSSGNGSANWSRSVTLASGANTITLEARDGAGNSSLQQFTLYYSPTPQSGPVVVSTISVSPSGGTGSAQTFALRYSDSAGAASLDQTWVWFNATFAERAADSCLLYYDNDDARLYLLNDAGNTWMPGLLATAATLRNSQCSVSLASSGWSMSGTEATLSLAMSFEPAYAGAKNVYMYAADAGGVNTGWSDLGDWGVPASSSGPPPPAAPSIGVSAVAATPDSGSGSTQTFSLAYASTAGASDLSTTWVWFNATFSNNSAGSCLLYYDRYASRLYLLNDAGDAWMPGSVSAAGTLQNSQCSVALGSSAVSSSGTTLTLSLAMTFKNAYAGHKNVYLYANNAAGTASGWHDRGDWIASGTGTPPPAETAVVSAVRASPDQGLGSSQVFALQYADSFGATDLSKSWVWFTPIFSSDSSGSCLIYHQRATGQVFLLNDAGTAFLSGALGTGQVLGNSQCSISLYGSWAAASGNTLTVNLLVSFSSSYSGRQNIYMYAENDARANSSWQYRGYWNVP